MIKKKKQNTPTFPIHQWGTNEYGFPTNNEHNWKSTSSISKKASKNKPRKTVYKAISGNIYTTEKEAINDNERYLSDPSYRFSYKSTNFPHYDPLFIPFIENKRVTLSDAGLATGAIISTNLLDSIAKYAEQTGLPIKTALGLATKESTLGNPTDDSSVVKLIGKDKALMMQRGQTGQHLNTTGAAIDARELVNYYKDTWNPYEVALEIADEKSRKLVPAPDGNVYDSKGNIVGTRFYHDDSGYEEYRQEKELADNKRRQIFNDILLSGEKYADNLAEKYKDKIKGNILEAAFTDYKNNPHGYNSGQPNYSELVEKRASEVWNSPEIQAWYNDYKNQKADGGSLNSKTWDNLSMAEKSEMMRVAIENGITTLPEIKEAYNEFAKGGYAPSKAIKDRITAYEGKAMTGAKDPITGKWGKNNSFESEAARFYSALPDSIREQVLNNPELADNLYSYSYNVGAGNFKKRVVPALERYYAGEGSVKDIENSMWASNDAKLRGLQRRRAEEKEGVRNALLGEVIPSLPTEQEVPAFMPSNPQAFFAPLESYQRPVIVEEPLVQAAMENPYSPEQLEREERAQGLRNLGLAMSIMRGGQEQSYSPLWSAVSMLSGNQMAKGGKIHIKPSHRDRLTELKKRTGKTEAELYKNGSAATRKMITFARNARKWKHGLGGNLFSGEDTPTQQMNNGLNLYRRTNNLGETEYIYQETPDSEEILLTPTNKRFSDDPTNWNYKDANGREYSPKMVNPTNSSTLEASEKMGPLEKYVAELNWRAKNDPASIALQGKYTMPAIAASALLPVAGEAFAGTTIAGVPATTWANTALTAGFAGHGLNHAINEGIDGWGDAAMTALEIAPLGRLARPMYNAGIDTAASGRRFILDVGDRYQGMKDAASYKDANGIKDARTIANTKWLESHEKPAGINRMGVNNDGSFGIYYPDNSESGHWYSPVIEKGGEMTLTTHLGGDFPGEYSKDLLPMSKSELAATIKYLRGVPEHTYFGEVGKTKNYAEQYFNENPSRIKAFRDAMHRKKEINEPYWNEEEHITDFMNQTDPIEQAYYRHLYEANEPISIDSYKLILQEAAKNNGKFALRYDSSPMGMFNPQGVYEKEFYNSLQSLTPKEQVKSINDWMRSYYPQARPAYLKNGEVMIPRPLLMLKSSK